MLKFLFLCKMKKERFRKAMKLAKNGNIAYTEGELIQPCWAGAVPDFHCKSNFSHVDQCHFIASMHDAQWGQSNLNFEYSCDFTKPFSDHDLKNL